MQATYRLRSDELDAEFLESIKKTFRHKKLEIHIIDEDEEDVALGRAIEKGREDEEVSEAELFGALRAD